MRESLLIEIGVEELPAIPLLKELPNIKKKWSSLLKSYSLESDFDFYYTPRRLVLISDNFPKREPDRKIELFGAPIEIAYKDGKPTQAAIGFAKKCGVSLDEIKRVKKGDKELLYYLKSRAGRDSKELLEPLIVEFLKSLNFGKSMRWGEYKESFIRPIRWAGVLFGCEDVKIELFGVSSKCETYGHRDFGFSPKPYKSIDEYLNILKNSCVILDQNIRERIILDSFKKIEQEIDAKIDLDRDLLSEVVSITEYPTPLIGSFDSSFLKLPPEVITLSMKEHQRYFPIYRGDELIDSFVFVANSTAKDFTKIIRGNEKVLMPRLSDALFFYISDIKRGLDSSGLKDVTFMHGLGSMYDKVIRESKIADYLYDRFKIDEFKKETLKEAVLASKSDLLTDMVYEFTELEGIMGYYYAKELGYDEIVALSFKEQYLPNSENSPLPSNNFSSILALSYRVDSILALFSKGKIPTGTKDPFALRRAAFGIIKIVIDREFRFNIRSDFRSLAKLYDNFDLDTLEEFFIDRLISFLDINPSIIKGVLSSGERDIGRVYKKALALDEIVSKDGFKDNFSTFKRVANIIKDIELKESIVVDSSLFESDSERELYSEYLAILELDFIGYKERLDSLFGLKRYIDNFFDNVMVNVDDREVRDNRKNLMAVIYREFIEIADIKEISL